LRILIFTHGFAPKIGGVETLVMLLAQGLVESTQHSAEPRPQVTLATPVPAGDWDDGALPFRVIRQPGLMTLVSLISSADVIHLAGPTLLPMLLGLILGKPVVVEHSGYQACCPNGLLLDERTKAVCPGHFMARRYFECVGCNAGVVGWWTSLKMLLLTFPRRWLLRKVARNVNPSAHVGRRVGLPRSVTIYHGVPQLPIAKLSASECLPSPVCFAYIGRLVWEKGVDVLLGAARELMIGGYDFRLKIIGDGHERSRLEKMADHYQLRGRITFTGYLQGEALQHAMREVSVTVMPSVWEETAGLSAVEHMMCGRLVIASDIGGLGELVGDAGLKFPPGDVESLALCLRRVQDEPKLVASIAEKAKQRALDLFRKERMIAAHRTLFSSLMPGQAPTHSRIKEVD